MSDGPFVTIESDQADEVKIIIQGPTCSTFNVLTRTQARVLAALILRHLDETEQAVREARCICNTGPSTDGPDETCPQHGRSLDRWIERGDILAGREADLRAKVARVEALYGGEPPPVWIRGTKIVRATVRRDDLGCSITESLIRVDDLRAALRGDA